MDDVSGSFPAKAGTENDGKTIVPGGAGGGAGNTTVEASESTSTVGASAEISEGLAGLVGGALETTVEVALLSVGGLTAKILGPSASQIALSLSWC